MLRLLLGSGGFSTEALRQSWQALFNTFLGDITSCVFIPFAVADHDASTAKMIQYGFNAGRNLIGIQHAEDPVACIENAQAIFVGGGNTFRLLFECQERGLIEAIQKRIHEGIPYIGISAGTNLACPTIMNTNDMPIVYPDSFDALGLIPFQINPHFVSGPLFKQTTLGYEQHGGETREDRIREFHEMNLLPVLGLYEGVSLRIEGASATLYGALGARLFTQNESPKDIPPQSDVSWLLAEDA